MTKKAFYLILALISYPWANAQNFSWANQYGGIGEDVSRNLYVDSEGNSYITGYFTDTSYFGSTELVANGWFDIFVSKTASNGDVVWAKGMGGNGFDYGTGITMDGDGNVYITGVFEESFDADPGAGEYILTSQGQQDIFVIKFDSTGEFLWAKTIGGIGYEETTSIGVDSDGGVYATGYFYDTTDFDPDGGPFEMTPVGSSDGFIVKYDSNGDFLWAKQIGGPDFDLPMAMKVMDDGDMYLTGQFREMADFDPDPMLNHFLEATPNYRGIFLLHLDTDGYFVEAVKVGEASDEAIGLDLDIDADGDVYLTGYYRNVLTMNTGTGDEFILDSDTYTEGYVAKVSFSSGIQWAKEVDCEEPTHGYGIGVNSLNETFISGSFSGTLNLDDIQLTQVNSNPVEFYLAKLDENGNYIAAYQYAGGVVTDTQNLFINENDAIFFTGTFEETVDLNPMDGEDLNATSLGFRDTYVIMMVSDILGTNDSDFTNEAVIFPNPSSGVFYVKSEQDIIGKAYQVYLPSGVKVAHGTVSQDQAIQLDFLPNGIYFMVVDMKHTFKVIKK